MTGQHQQHGDRADTVERGDVPTGGNGPTSASGKTGSTDCRRSHVMPSRLASEHQSLRAARRRIGKARLCFYFVNAMYLVSRYSSMPSVPPSRPNPDSLMPPNGAAGSEMTPRLIPTMPDSMASATRNARSSDCV